MGTTESAEELSPFNVAECEVAEIEAEAWTTIEAEEMISEVRTAEVSVATAWREAVVVGKIWTACKRDLTIDRVAATTDRSVRLVF